MSASAPLCWPTASLLLAPAQLIGGVARYQEAKRRAIIGDAAKTALTEAIPAWGTAADDDFKNPLAVVFARSDRRAFARTKGRRSSGAFPRGLFCKTADDAKAIREALRVGIMLQWNDASETSP